MRTAYYRVSTGDQSITAQRHALGGKFDREFTDEGISGGVMAADRPGFAKLLEQVRRGDTVCVYAVDRLGRDAIDVQATVKRLTEAGVTLDIHGIGVLSGDVARLTLAIFAQLAEMERSKIKERTAAGREAARASLAATGKTHKGKLSLGRPKAQDGAEVVAWRAANGASIAETAAHFGLSVATVKRYQAGHVGSVLRTSSRPDVPSETGSTAAQAAAFTRGVDEQAADDSAPDEEEAFPWEHAWGWRSEKPTTISVDSAGNAKVVKRSRRPPSAT